MRQRLLKHLSLFVFFVFILNLLGSFFSWYTLLPWYDNMMHFLGGAWLSLVACFLYSTAIKERKFSIISVLLFVLIGALLWEVLEYFVEYLTRAPGALANIPDSISDILFGLLGGFIFGSHTIKQIKKS